MIRSSHLILLGILGLNAALAVENDQEKIREFIKNKNVWPGIRIVCATEVLPENDPLRIKTLRSIARDKHGEFEHFVVIDAANALPEGDPVRRQVFRKMAREEQREAKRKEWERKRPFILNDKVRHFFGEKDAPFL